MLDDVFAEDVAKRFVFQRKGLRCIEKDDIVEGLDVGVDTEAAHELALELRVLPDRRVVGRACRRRGRGEDDRDDSGENEGAGSCLHLHLSCTWNRRAIRSD